MSHLLRCAVEHLRRRIHWLVLAVGVLLCIPTFAYRFGRDQALFYYVGREWLHGLVPYRDAFDQKPPLIYVVHALGIRLFGPGQWVIRVLESSALLLLGWACVRLADGHARSSGTRVAHGFLVSCILYYIYFDYWNTAQVELWEALSVMLALVVAQDVRSWRWASAFGGLFLGVAFLFKFPALAFAPLLAIVLAWRVPPETEQRRHPHRFLQSALLVTLGALLPILLVVAVFAAQGALRDLWDVTIGYNALYVSNKRTPAGSHLASFMFDHNAMATALCFGALLVDRLRTRSRPDWHPAGVALLGYSLGIVTIIAQGKFYAYHYAILVPFESMMILIGLRAVERAPEFRRTLLLAAMLGLALLAAPVWHSNLKVTYPRYVVYWSEWIRGQKAPGEFSRLFVDGRGYSYAALEAIGHSVEEHKLPGDMLHVHGFEPIPYVISGLRSPSRFFAEYPLVDPRLGYRRSEWIEQHNRALAARPPRFVVDFVYETERIRLRTALGYRPLARAEQFVLLVKDPPP